MKEKDNSPEKFESLSDAHRIYGLPKPMHLLISLIDNTIYPVPAQRSPDTHVLKFYKIAYRTKFSGKLRYGQDYYDFDEGGLLFASPNQLIGSYNYTTACSGGYSLLIHPDFFLNYPLAKKIKQYGFFSYSANEALHLSPKEEEIIWDLYLRLTSSA